MESFKKPTMGLSAKILVIISLFLISSSCINTDNEDVSKSSYEELFNLYLSVNGKHELDSIENILCDSLLANPNKHFRLIEYADTSQNTLSQEFKAYLPDPSSPLLLRKRNIYLIEVGKSSTIKKNDSAVFEKYLSEKNILEFLLNTNHKDHHPEKKRIHIDYFDSVLVSKGGFIINANILSDSINNTSWYQIKRAINQIKKVNQALMDTISINKWSIQYAHLPLNKKLAVSKYFPLSIWVFPNRPKK